MSHTPLFTCLLLSCLLASAAAATYSPANLDGRRPTDTLGRFETEARVCADGQNCHRHLQSTYATLEGARIERPKGAREEEVRVVEPVALKTCADGQACRRLQATYQQAEGRRDGRRGSARVTEPVDITLRARDVEAARRPSEEDGARKLQATYTEVDKKVAAGSFNAPVDARVSARSMDLGTRIRDDEEDGRRLQSTYATLEGARIERPKRPREEEARVVEPVALKTCADGQACRHLMTDSDAVPEVSWNSARVQRPREADHNDRHLMTASAVPEVGWNSGRLEGRRDGRTSDRRLQSTYVTLEGARTERPKGAREEEVRVVEPVALKTCADGQACRHLMTDSAVPEIGWNSGRLEGRRGSRFGGRRLQSTDATLEGAHVERPRRPREEEVRVVEPEPLKHCGSADSCRRLQYTYATLEGARIERPKRPREEEARVTEPVALKTCADGQACRRLQATYQQVEGRRDGRRDGARVTEPVDITLHARDVETARRPSEEDGARKLQATYTEVDKKVKSGSFNAPVDARVSARGMDLGARIWDDEEDGRRLQSTYATLEGARTERPKRVREEEVRVTEPDALRPCASWSGGPSCRRLQSTYATLEGARIERPKRPREEEVRVVEPVALKTCADGQACRRLQATYQQAEGRRDGRRDSARVTEPVDITLRARDVEAARRPSEEDGARKLQATYTEVDKKVAAGSFNAPVDARVSARGMNLGARIRGIEAGGRKMLSGADGRVSGRWGRLARDPALARVRQEMDLRDRGNDLDP